MTDPETTDPITEGVARFQEMVVSEYERDVERSQWLTQKVLDFSRWAPYIDWSLRLKGEGVIENERLLSTFHDIKRYDFLPNEAKPMNIDDNPVGIGHNQTNSQPTTVAKMIDWLDPQPGDKVLDIGIGSGWTTALVAHMVGESGSVLGTERIEELMDFAAKNIGQYPDIKAELKHTPNQIGFKEEAPYDRILVSAGTPEEWLPELIEQLSPDGGIIVVPVVRDIDTHKNSEHDKQLWVIRRNDNEHTILHIEDDYAFVPLLKDEEVDAPL